MSDIEMMIRLPEALLAQAKADGVMINDTSIAHMIEAELVRAQAANRLREAMRKLEGSLTLEEIEDELAKSKVDRIAAVGSKSE